LSGSQRLRFLFVKPFDAARASSLKTNVDEAERTDAFVARFGRLQDTLADKLLPTALDWLAEPVGAAIPSFPRRRESRAFQKRPGRPGSPPPRG
jgi:hypothetical protein